MLKLISCNVSPVDGDDTIEATYGAHASIATGTVVVPVILSTSMAGASITLGQMPSAAAADEEQAFDGLAAILEATAKAIRERGEVKLGVPIY
ncbi:hypothetical protein CBP36_19680 (plasmid) [Acidovorax carolinensis]|uniref:Uncharacterized protein n=1 Tax=Acidovorax carolinensis TaxID=553814 RepID=A0A240UI92_9BURK|nr:hypothetical protein [Acidovorax carolinensis]ART57127.1 hypothetical protein CBP35_19635 [Acidovorax carolinensis]ART61188.1 hypothetical protein CBP36_19680 [Acidovorax carolinensis]